MTAVRISAITLTALGLLLILVGPGHGFTKVGTTAGSFLKIGAGARAEGMAGAFVALADDATCLYWNPAGLVQLEGKNIAGDYTNWLAGIQHGFTGMTFRTSRNDAVGVGILYLNSGEMDVTTLSEQEGTGQTFSFSSVCLGASYARRFTDRFSFGITGKYIQEKVFDTSANTFAVDLGSIFVTDFYGLRIGAAMLNLGGGMKLSGPGLLLPGDPYTGIRGNPEVNTDLSTESWPLPLIFKAGIALDVVGSGSAIKKSSFHTLTVLADGVHPGDNRETLNWGVEWELGQTLALRGGYQLNDDESTINFGGGIGTTLGMIRLRTDYALSGLGDLGYTHRFGVGMGF
jgi:hypothetical protein